MEFQRVHALIYGRFYLEHFDKGQGRDLDLFLGVGDIDFRLPSSSSKAHSS